MIWYFFMSFMTLSNFATFFEPGFGRREQGVTINVPWNQSEAREKKKMGKEWWGEKLKEKVKRKEGTKLTGLVPGFASVRNGCHFRCIRIRELLIKIKLWRHGCFTTWLHWCRCLLVCCYRLWNRMHGRGSTARTLPSQVDAAVSFQLLIQKSHLLPSRLPLLFSIHHFNRTDPVVCLVVAAFNDRWVRWCILRSKRGHNNQRRKTVWCASLVCMNDIYWFRGEMGTELRWGTGMSFNAV